MLEHLQQWEREEVQNRVKSLRSEADRLEKKVKQLKEAADRYHACSHPKDKLKSVGCAIECIVECELCGFTWVY